MATWFAQTTGNINAANQWNSNPAGGGTVLTWPPAVDDVLVANGKTITVNVSVTVAELRNGTTGGATNGGIFVCTTAGVTVTANVYEEGGTAVCLRFSHTSGTVNLVGNAYGGGVTNTTPLFTNASGGTVSITGNIYAGSAVQASGLNIATGTMTINITGAVYGPNGGTAFLTSAGIYNNSPSAVTLTGNAIAGTANNDGIAGLAIYNLTTGSVSVSGYVEASANSAAISNLAQGVVTVGETRSASNGRGAVMGAFRYASATTLTHRPLIAGVQRTMSLATDISAMVPAASNVRVGVKYGNGLVGTAAGLGSKTISMTRRF